MGLPKDGLGQATGAAPSAAGTGTTWARAVDVIPPRKYNGKGGLTPEGHLRSPMVKAGAKGQAMVVPCGQTKEENSGRITTIWLFTCCQPCMVNHKFWK